MPVSNDPLTARSYLALPPTVLVVVCVIAATPGLVVLQGLPRLIGIEEYERSLPLLALASTFFPFVGALAGGLTARILARADWRTGAAAGIASQVPALPGYLAALADSLDAGFLTDVFVLTALLASYLVLSVSCAVFPIMALQQDRRASDIPWASVADSARLSTAFLVVSFFLLSAALLSLGYPGMPWFYAILLALGASVLPLSVIQKGASPWARRLALALLVASLATASLAVMLLISLAVAPTMPPVVVP